jgi:hypothetical protein
MTQPTLKSSNGSAPWPSSPSPGVPPGTEVTPKAKRRSFTAAYKQQILLGRTALSPGPSPRSHRTCSFPASGEPVKDPIRGTQSSSS